jgi:FecR protein
VTEQQGVGSGGDSNERVDRALTDALAKPRLDAAALARIHDAVEREWRAANPSRTGLAMPWRRARWPAVMAAASLFAVTTAYVAIQFVSAPVVVGRLERGTADAARALIRHRMLSSGDPLRVGDTLTTRSPALVALLGGGSLRIEAGSVVIAESELSLSLERGRVYIDIPPAFAAVNRLRILTAAGAVEHVGTQYEVLSDAQSVRIRVREGRIRLVGGAETVEADGGTELLVRPGGRAARGSVMTYGGDWLWTAALAPDYDIEGRRLADFLVWVSRELGRHLDFEDPRARDVANTTILHGSVRGLAPIEALRNVISTTSLTYEIRGDTIRVHSAT